MKDESMKRTTTNCSGLLITLCLITGCGELTTSRSSDNTVEQGSSNTISDKSESHAHPTTGPHQGDLIELGREEFHGELLHDEESVTIYILDSSATKTVPIDAAEVTINLRHFGKPRQFRLPASPTENDPAELSSRFMLIDSELAAQLDDESARPSLNVTINGTAYRGQIAHHHDHAGHDHNH